MCGFPHFRKVSFRGEFPIAEVTFSDESFPADVVIIAFNPFIPLDADNSSIPAAFFDIQVRTKLKNVTYTLIFAARNAVPKSCNTAMAEEDGKFIHFTQSAYSERDPEYTDFAIAVQSKQTLYQEYFYRGGWQDAITVFWDEFHRGKLENRHYNNPGHWDVGLVGAVLTPEPGQPEGGR